MMPKSKVKVLVVAYDSQHSIQPDVYNNKAVAFDPNGNRILDYTKRKITPGDPDTAGNTPLQVFSTPYGRIGVAICYDTDFPAYIHTIDAQKPDILLIPKSDWSALVPMHTYIGMMRCVENGFSTVSQTSNGLSAAYDEQGNLISNVYSADSDNKVMLSNVPTKGTVTIYRVVGDSFAWPVHTHVPRHHCKVAVLAKVTVFTRCGYQLVAG